MANHNRIPNNGYSWGAWVTEELRAHRRALTKLENGMAGMQKIQRNMVTHLDTHARLLQEHSRLIGALWRAVGSLQKETKAGFQAADRRFAEIDERLGEVSGRLGGVDDKLDRILKKIG